MRLHSNRRHGVVTVVGVAACAATMALGTSSAAADPPQQDPVNQLKSDLLCVPEGSVLRPTQACSVYDPATETYTNPYTENGDSPGILGLGALGLL